MISVHPTKIEATDEDGRVMFTVEMMDRVSAIIEMKTVVVKEDMDNLTAAMRRAIVMLELE